MPQKPVVIVIHGMGKHAEGAFKKEFVGAANTLLKQFGSHAHATVEDLADVYEINYDGFFDGLRQQMADAAKPVDEVIGGLDLSGFPGLVSRLVNLEAKYGEDEFFYTHLLDVFFYSTFMGERVRVDVANQFAKIMARHPDQPVTIVAHSLGTAVIHDTLAKLYRGEFDVYDNVPSLDVITHRLQGIWMVANVSRLVNMVSNMFDPYATRVKPSAEGCANKLRNVHHQLDPFALIRSFAPPDDGSWISPEDYRYNFRDIETSAVRVLNTHSFPEYIENPRVGTRLLQELFEGFRPDRDDREKVQDTFNQSTLEGAFEQVKDEVDDLDLSNADSIKGLAGAIMDFRKVVKGFGEIGL